MQARPSVSVILLCYNCDQFVAEAIRSVVEQEYDEPMEIIVSDDASTDDTLGEVERELARYRGARGVRFFRRTVVEKFGPLDPEIHITLQGQPFG